MSITQYSPAEILDLTNWIKANTSFMPEMSSTDIAKKIFWQNAHSVSARYSEAVQVWFDQPANKNITNRNEAYNEFQHMLIVNCYEGDTPEEKANYQFCLMALQSILADPSEIETFDTKIGKYVTERRQHNHYHDAYIVGVSKQMNRDVYIIGAYDIFGQRFIKYTRSINDVVISDCRPQLSIQQCKRFLANINDELNAIEAEQKKQRQLAEAAEKEFSEYFEKNIPFGTEAVIVAQYVENTSNMNEDYHGHSTQKSIIIGWSKSTRNTFPELKRAAKVEEQTAYLAEPPSPENDMTNFEQRQSYGSIKAFLKDSPNENKTGWMVRKINLFKKGATYVPISTIHPSLLKQPTEKKMCSAQKTNPSVNAKMIFNDAKGGVEIHFSEIPNAQILALLSNSAFSYHRKNKYWYSRRTDETISFGKKIEELANSNLEVTTQKQEHIQQGKHLTTVRALLFNQ
jgi:hypothetical protein